MGLFDRWSPKVAFPCFVVLLSGAVACSPEAPTAEPGDEAAAAAPGSTGELPLPTFTPCASTAHPVLPARWRATALMQDFFFDTVWFGNFVYDESVEAFRFSLADRYGIDFDLLTTTDGRLYLLEGGGETPTGCSLLTKRSPFTVPARDWLAGEAVCVGEAPILARDQRWWKSPSGVGANWFWYDTGSSLPFRNMYFAEPTDPAPIYEYFTFNYFPSFEPAAETNLPQILELCRAAGDTETARTAYAGSPFEPLMAKSRFPETDARLIEQIQGWIPGLSECSSTDSLPPPWPERLQLTAFLTAVSFEPNPFPTRVYYDWSQKAQNSTLYYFPPTPQDFAQVALLLDDTGYIAFVEEGGGISKCEQVLPGPPVRQWKQVDDCECRLQIAPRTVLNPSDVPTKVLWCPTDLELEQVFWTWYSDTGTPVVFMQSNSSPTAGTGLNLADYHRWQPGSIAPSGTFDLPAACEGQPKQPGAFPKACNNCHLPLNEGRGEPVP